MEQKVEATRSATSDESKVVSRSRGKMTTEHDSVDDIQARLAAKRKKRPKIRPLERPTGPRTHIITVGAAGTHQFQPLVTRARIGDTIKFQFFPLNHSVVRADFGNPCIPFEDTGAGRVGFFSGFKPVDQVLQIPPSWSVRVNDTKPIFYYCSAPGSCVDHAMVGAINPSRKTPILTQQRLAKEADYVLQPGEPFPSEGAGKGKPFGKTPHDDSQSHGIGGGAIAGIVIGLLLLLALAVGIWYFVSRWYLPKKRRHESQNKQRRGSSRILQISRPLELRESYVSPDGYQIERVAFPGSYKLDNNHLERVDSVAMRDFPPSYHVNANLAHANDRLSPTATSLHSQQAILVQSPHDSMSPRSPRSPLTPPRPSPPPLPPVELPTDTKLGWR